MQISADNFLRTTLLTTPFGALQTVAILLGCYCAYRVRIKSAVLVALMALTVIGCGMIYSQGVRPESFQQSVGLAGYYLMAFLYGGPPLIVSWDDCQHRRTDQEIGVGRLVSHAAQPLTPVASWPCSTRPRLRGTSSGHCSLSPRTGPHITFPVRARLWAFLSL